MLAISRGISEIVWIGNIKVQVIRIRHGQVVLGIDAPQDVHIIRDELIARDAAAASTKVVRQ